MEYVTEEQFTEAMAIVKTYLSQKKPLVRVAEKLYNIDSLLIEDIGLSVRAYNSLKSKRVNRVIDLVKITKKELLTTNNFGVKSLKELIKIVAEYHIVIPD